MEERRERVRVKNMTTWKLTGGGCVEGLKTNDAVRNVSQVIQRDTCELRFYRMIKATISLVSEYFRDEVVPILSHVEIDMEGDKSVRKGEPEAIHHENMTVVKESGDESERFRRELSVVH